VKDREAAYGGMWRQVVYRLAPGCGGDNGYVVEGMAIGDKFSRASHHL